MRESNQLIKLQAITAIGILIFSLLPSIYAPPAGNEEYWPPFTSKKHPYGTPMFQLKGSTPVENIRCDAGLILLIKHNGNPACVKPETKQKLVERGWIGSSEFYGLAEFQAQAIQQTKFTCAKVVDYEQCMKQLEQRKAFFRQQNQKEYSNKISVEINGLNSEYKGLVPIEFSTHIISTGNDCFTLVTSIEGARYAPSGTDILSTRLVCPDKSESGEFSDDFKFNTREYMRIPDKGEYKLVISAVYYKETKILAEKKFSIN